MMLDSKTDNVAFCLLPNDDAAVVALSPSVFAAVLGMLVSPAYVLCELPQ